MKRLAFAAAAAGGTVLALRRLAPKARELHAHCRATMRTCCGGATAGCRPESSPRGA